jgi:hypothetical protein
MMRRTQQRNQPKADGNHRPQPVSVVAGNGRNQMKYYDGQVIDDSIEVQTENLISLFNEWQDALFIVHDGKTGERLRNFKPVSATLNDVTAIDTRTGSTVNVSEAKMRGDIALMEACANLLGKKATK